jgi:hypothetical protein
MTTESSVLTNLRELSRLESERIADETARAAEKERAAREAKARAEREAAEAEAHARRLVEAQARLELDEERAGRDAEAEQRLAALRAELAAVQADRERMHTHIATLADDGWADRSARDSSWGWKAAFASAGAVAAGLALILAVREPVQPTRIVQVPVERTVYVEQPATDEAEAENVEETDGPLIGTAEGGEDRPAAMPSGGGRVRPPRPDVRPRMGAMEPDPLGDLDCGEDDPTCGI